MTSTPPPPIPSIDTSSRKPSPGPKPSKPSRPVVIGSVVAVAIVVLIAVVTFRPSRQQQQVGFIPGITPQPTLFGSPAQMQEPETLRGLSVVGKPTWQEGTDGNGWVCIVDFDLNNNSRQIISKLMVVIEHAQPDRTVPHGSAKDYIEISGGIEPGETKTVRASVSARGLKMGDTGRYVTEVAPGHIIRGSIVGGMTTQDGFTCNVPFTCTETRSTQPKMDGAMQSLFQ